MDQREGDGWRLARDCSRGKYSYLIGGESWAFELTEKEWKALASLIDELVREHERLSEQLLPDESITLELQKEFWWGTLVGGKSAWSLKFIMEGNSHISRSLEAFWPDNVAQEIALEMRKMWAS